MSEYADRDVIQLDRDGGYYCRHVAAMTAEGLHSKADIAAELAWRDREIARLKATNSHDPATSAAQECDHDWRPDADVMNAWYCPKCDVTRTKIATHPQPVTPAGGEVVAYRYFADEGVYNPFVRDWLDGSPDQLDLENIARHPGVRFEFAYSNQTVPDHELQQKWFRRGWDMYVELHGETHPPVADAAHPLYAACQRAASDLPEGWEIRICLESGAGTVELIDPDGEVTNMDVDADDRLTAEVNAAIDAALNQRGGGDHG